MNIKKRIVAVLREVDKLSPRPMLYTFRMSEKEKALFDKYVRKAINYLEFGMGGSTLRALIKSKAKICSVDSSAEWISKMREYSIVRKMEDRLSLIHVDIGPLKEWGTPIGTDYRKYFPNYSAYIFEILEKEVIDTVLVDGRFRVACTLKTLMECHPNDNLRIMIHDFWNREHYHVVLKYLDEIERADTLGVFAPKKNIDLSFLEKNYEEYKYTFD